MPLRDRQRAVLLPRRLMLAAATAVAAKSTTAARAATTTAATVERGPPGTASRTCCGNRNEHTSVTLLSAARASSVGFFSTTLAEDPRSQRALNAIPWSSMSRRRRVHGRHSNDIDNTQMPDPSSQPYSARSAGTSTSSRSGHSKAKHPSFWVVLRGGAVGKKRAGGEPGRTALAEDGGDEEGEQEEVQEDEDGDEEEEDVADDDADPDADADGSEEAGGDEPAARRDGVKAGESDGESGAEAGRSSSIAGASAKESASGADTFDLKTILPQALKTGAFFLLARWLGNKLSPTVESQVRTARAIYTTYLIFSQALCMYIRYLIWKSDDDSEIEVPPPPQLKNLMSGKGGGLGEALPGVLAGGGEAASSAAASLGPMLDKMMTSKTPVKKYDMKTIQGVRRGQFWASLIMCYTHLKRGMIKPMMMQVSFGVLALLDSPLFHIYVLGREAKGNYARPFKKQGLMASLSGPMEAMSAKAAEAAEAAKAAQSEEDKTAASTTNDSSSGDSTGDGSVAEDGDDTDMPDVEVLTDGD